MQRRRFAATLVSLLTVAGLSAVRTPATTISTEYLAKVRVTPDGAEVYAEKGLSGVTVALQNQMHACRFAHELFWEGTTFANATLVELADDEGKFTIAVGNGILDVVCYGPSAQPASYYNFQIIVRVESES